MQSWRLVSLCMQDYKSQSAAGMICAAMVNIKMDTHRHRDR